MKRISTLLFTIGVISYLLAIFFIWQRNNTNSLSFRNYQPADFHYQASVSQAKQLIIPALQIDLPIFPEKITNNTWPVTTSGVSYLASSVIPGQRGNSILYGHNWKVLLGSLPYANQGMLIQIVHADKTVDSFIVRKIQIVDPTNVGILAQSNDTRLTIYTCTGFLDSKRFVVTALLKSTNKVKAQNAYMAPARS